MLGDVAVLQGGSSFTSTRDSNGIGSWISSGIIVDVILFARCLVVCLLCFVLSK